MTQPSDPSGPDQPSDVESTTSQSAAPEAPEAGAPQYPQYPSDAGDAGVAADPSAYGYTKPVPPGHHFDPESGHVLPDGTELASVGRRIGGYFLDALLVIVTLGIGYLIWALIVWARGQTPAKQILNMRCYRPTDQRSASWGWMALRQFVGGTIVEGLIPFVFIASAIMMIVSKDHKAIHDHIANTIVLYDPEKVLAAKS